MNSTQEILESIDTRLRKLNEEIDTLTAARSALHAREQQPPTKPPRRTRKQRARAVSARPRTAVSTRQLHETLPEVSHQPVPRSRKRSSKAARPTPRPALKGISTDHLESLLSKNGGLTTSELAEQAKANREHVLKLLRDMESAGRIRRSGQRRGTRWHAITDEDRIRQRTAELETSRKNRA